MGENYKLTIELVPKTSWYNNVRSKVSSGEWDIIRKKSYKIANYVCQICGDNGINQGFSHPVECHEVWKFDDTHNIQKLIGFISLCPLCHKVKHIGLVQVNNEIDIAKNHLMKVNSIGKRTATIYIEQSFNIWRKRNKNNWLVDVNYIQKFLNYNK